MKKEEKVKSAEEVLNYVIDKNFRKLFGDNDTDWIIQAMEEYHTQQLKAYQDKLIEKLNIELYNPVNLHYQQAYNDAIRHVINHIQSHQLKKE